MKMKARTRGSKPTSQFFEVLVSRSLDDKIPSFPLSITAFSSSMLPTIACLLDEVILFFPVEPTKENVLRAVQFSLLTGRSGVYAISITNINMKVQARTWDCILSESIIPGWYVSKTLKNRRSSSGVIRVIRHTQHRVMRHASCVQHSDYDMDYLSSGRL
jgi:hypothetical protein